MVRCTVVIDISTHVYLMAYQGLINFGAWFLSPKFHEVKHEALNPGDTSKPPYCTVMLLGLTESLDSW